MSPPDPSVYGSFDRPPGSSVDRLVALKARYLVGELLSHCYSDLVGRARNASNGGSNVMWLGCY